MTTEEGIAMIHAADETAFQSVFAERIAQIDRGRTPAQDNEFTPAQILESFGMPGGFTREELVRYAAVFISAIARMDRDGLN